MAKNSIKDLRDHLFETIEALKDPDAPMDLARAAAISDVAQVIINSAKVEVDLLKAVNGSTPISGNFFGMASEDVRALPPAARDKGNWDRG